MGVVAPSEVAGWPAEETVAPPADIYSYLANFMAEALVQRVKAPVIAAICMPDWLQLPAMLVSVQTVWSLLQQAVWSCNSKQSFLHQSLLKTFTDRNQLGLYLVTCASMRGHKTGMVRLRSTQASCLTCTHPTHDNRAEHAV